MDCAWRDLDLARCFHSVGKGKSEGHAAIARGATGQSRGLVDGRARHQALDALVDVTEALFQPHDGLAIGGEAEMPRLDDAGMNRTDGDLVQVFSLGRQERVRRTLRRRHAALPERVLHIPEAEVEPGPGVGQPYRQDAVEIVNGPLQTYGRRMHRPDGREAIVRTEDRDDCN